MVGVFAIWLMYDVITEKIHISHPAFFIYKVCSFTFLIYLFHEPTLNIVRKLIVAVAGKIPSGYLISYLVSPFIFMAVAVVVGMFLKKYTPKIYGILTGGR
jgi:hypothetical protein